MIKFTYNLSNYKPVKVLPEIKRVIKIDRQKLQDGIDEFQNELNWKEMWSVDDAQKRLDDGWWFYVIEKNDKYVGWAWFDVSNKQFCNLYVHKDLRDGGLGKDLVYARLNECKEQGIDNVWMEVDDWNKSIQKITQKLGWDPKIHYTFWTGGYDSTFYVIKSILEGKIVQPIYIDDRVNHGGYHANPLVKQRGGDTYPRKSTEIELERMDWLRQRIYEKIEKSKYLLLETMVIDKPIEEDEEISKVVEKYNEWIPNTISEKGWLPVYTDLVSRFQKQFGLEIFWANDHIEGEFYEVFDDSIEDGRMKVDKLPFKYKDLEIFSGLNQPLRITNKKEMLEEAEQKGFDDLLYYTWTCWNPQGNKSCNKCKPCKERIIECRSIGDTILTTKENSDDTT
jgi:GNAT superfamily N-acetyltransferase